MDDGMLSQDEIDALLNMEPDDAEAEENTSSTSASHDNLTDIEIDTLGEIGNISFGSSATTLSTLLNQKVDITTPEVSVISRETLNEEYLFEQVNVQVEYIEGFSGQNNFILKSTDAAIISDIMLGGEGTSPDEHLSEIHLSAVQEAMNQMMGAAATSMSTIFNKKVDISPPSIELKDSEEPIETEEVVVKVSFQLKVGDLIDSHIMQLMPLRFAKDLVGQLLNASEEETTATAEKVLPEEMEQKESPVPDQPTNEFVHEQQKGHHTTQTHDAPEQERESQYIGHAGNNHTHQVEQAAFSNFEQNSLNQHEKRNLDMLLDIPLKVSVELGRTNRTIKEILELSSGSIIELDKLAGEPVDILINQKLIAKGEVVVIDENFGVRLTDIISQSDRLKQLK